MPNSQSGDFDIDTRRHFRFEGGQNSPYGKVSYRVLTNLGAGHGWYQNGTSEDHQMVATGRSVESLGHKVKKSKTNESDPLLPAKLIRAKHGDIILEAVDGDIILKGDNIIMYADGIRNTGDGDIQMYANKAVSIEGSDVRVSSANLRLIGKKDFSLIGKVYGNITAGVLNASASSDFGASTLLGKMKGIAESLGAI